MLRRLSRLAMIIAPLAVVGALAPAGPAVACSCAVITEAEAFDAAQVVFTGELVEVLPPPPAEITSSGDPERYIFAVDRVYKGTAFDEQSVVTARDGASCGLEISGPGPFIVFAHTDDGDWVEQGVEGELHANLCGGTRAVDAAGVPRSFGAGALPEEGSSPVGGPTGSTGGPTTTSTTSSTGTAAAPEAESGGTGTAPALVIAALGLAAGVGGLAVLAIRRRRA